MKETVLQKYDSLQKLLSFAGTILNVKEIIAILIAFVMFVLCVLTFRKKVNKISKKQIQSFVNEGKYLPDVYVELNGVMESLRYFAFSRRWKYRLIKQYNHLFSGYEGNRLKRIFGNSKMFNLSIFASIEKIKEALAFAENSLNDLHSNRSDYSEKFGESIWLVTNSTYLHKYTIENLRKLCALIEQKNVVLVGSAGNGKTSLLCRMAEIIIANKMPCILINARDIRGNCADYVRKKIQPYSFLRGKEIILKFVSIALFLQRKNIYILIDAINENDHEDFTDSIGEMLDIFSSYKRIRILLSCRSEYFDYRYSKYFKPGSEAPYIYRIDSMEYDDRTSRKLIEAYMNHYKVRGPFAYPLREKFMNSLLLTRIFFEVNSGRSQCALEFCNAEIYKQYFAKIANENSQFDLQGMVNNIARLMFEQFTFDQIPMEALQLSSTDKYLFKKLMDNNLIISHTIRTGTGITENKEEYVYFVFDELRDFCLARYLLMTDMNNRDNSYSTFFAKSDLLYKQRLSPIEGVVKYAYHYFKEVSRYDLCSMLLNMFGEFDAQNFPNGNKQHRTRNMFKNFGFSLIFSEGDDLSDFEMDYIISSIMRNESHYWNVFWYLLMNEYSKLLPNVDVAVDVISRLNDSTIVKKIFEYFFDDKHSGFSIGYNEKRRVDKLVESVERIQSRNGKLSKSLKIILVILSAYAPLEFGMNLYQQFVLDDSVCAGIKKVVHNCEILNSLSRLREKISSFQNAENVFDDICLKMELGGENE